MKRVIALTFGLGGHVEYYAREGNTRSRLSGYDRPDTWKPDEGVDYSSAIVLDRRDMFTRKPTLAFTLPMIDDVPDDEPSRFADIPGVEDSIVLNAIAGQNDAFGTIARAAKTLGRAYSGLDEVSPATYAALAKSEGARLGRVIDGRIEWDS